VSEEGSAVWDGQELLVYFPAYYSQVKDHEMRRAHRLRLLDPVAPFEWEQLTWNFAKDYVGT